MSSRASLIRQAYFIDSEGEKLSLHERVSITLPQDVFSSVVCVCIQVYMQARVYMRTRTEVAVERLPLSLITSYFETGSLTESQAHYWLD